MDYWAIEYLTKGGKRWKRHGPRWVHDLVWEWDERDRRIIKHYSDKPGLPQLFWYWLAVDLVKSMGSRYRLIAFTYEETRTEKANDN